MAESFLPLFLSRSIFYYLPLSHVLRQFSKSDTCEWPVSVAVAQNAGESGWKLVKTHVEIRSENRGRAKWPFIGGSPRTRRGNMQRIVLEYRIVPQYENNIEGYSPPCNVRQKLRQRGHESFIHFERCASSLALDFNKKLHGQYNSVRLICQTPRRKSQNESRFSEKFFFKCIL